MKMPPKKKKSGAKKLANMTEEERMIYLEQKRLAEEEMRRKKEEMLTQFLKVFFNILLLCYYILACSCRVSPLSQVCQNICMLVQTHSISNEISVALMDEKRVGPQGEPHKLEPPLF